MRAALQRYTPLITHAHLNVGFFSCRNRNNTCRPAETAKTAVKLQLHIFLPHLLPNLAFQISLFQLFPHSPSLALVVCLGPGGLGNAPLPPRTPASTE